MYRLLICAFFVLASSEVKEEDNEVISSTVKSIASRDYSETVTLEKFIIELRNIEISNFKTLRSMEGSTWLKDYSAEGNVDYMNLTLKLDKLMVKVRQVLVGPTSLSVSFDIEENEMKVRATSKGYLSPGKCDIKFDDIEVTKLNKVTMHSDVAEYESLDVSSFIQDLALPLVNRVIKSSWFDQYLPLIADHFCKLAESSGGKTP